MPAPRTFLVVVLVVAGLLVLLFVLGVGGAFRMGKPDLKALSGSFGAHRLQLADLPSDSAHPCPAVSSTALQLNPGATCALVAPASTDPIWRRRSIVLRASAPLHVTVTPAGTSSPPVDGKPDPGKDAEFPLPRERALIALECAAATGTCTVTWQR
jgi:hypothetical protein